LSWYSLQAAPRSASSFRTVFIATPVMRHVERSEQPSIRQEITRDRVAVSSRFMLNTMRERSRISNGWADR
jgi:hypothetical protein